MPMTATELERATIALRAHVATLPNKRLGTKEAKPGSKVTDPELKTALDALRAGIAGAAPASKLQALQSQVDAIDARLASRQLVESARRPRRRC